MKAGSVITVGVGAAAVLVALCLAPSRTTHNPVMSTSAVVRTSRALSPVLAPIALRGKADGMHIQTALQRAARGRAIGFEPNQGQTDAGARFLAHSGGYALFLTGHGMVLSLPGSQDSEVRSQNPTTKWQGASGRWQGTAGLLRSPFTLHNSALSQPSAPNTRHPTRDTVRLTLVGANPHPKMIGLDKLKGISNYFIGNDPKKWRVNVPNYAKVLVKDVYPGIDQIFYGKDGQLEYDFIVHPGADPRAIEIALENQKTKMDANGDIVVPTDSGEVRLGKPVVYQVQEPLKAHNSELITGNYVLTAHKELNFQIGKFDRSRSLVIDPTLKFLTTFGGTNGGTTGQGIAVDAGGNAYVAGETVSSDFPVTPGAFQGSPSGGSNGVVLKIDNSGAVVYATYLAGSGTSINLALAIAVDPSGDAYVTGTTNATDFPVLNAFQPTLTGGAAGFVTEFNLTGSALVYSSYLGGSGPTLTVNDEQGVSIAVDSGGNAYVTGQTASSDFPTTANAFQPVFGGGQCGSRPCVDAFITKVASGGATLTYSTYLGGTSDDDVSHIAIDPAGDAYVAGGTHSFDFPVLNAFQPACVPSSDTLFPCGTAFVTELGPSGSALVFSTYLGGSGGDGAGGIALDSAGNIYVTGVTASTDFPTANAIQPSLNPAPGQPDAFVTEFNSGASQLVYSTYLGGSGDDFGTGVAVDSLGEAYITGLTDSTDFPVSNALQATYGGGTDDAFVTAFQAGGGGLIYSTYLGGGGQDIALGIAGNGAGDVWVTGISNSTTFLAAVNRPEIFRRYGPRRRLSTTTLDQGTAGSIALDMSRVNAAPGSLAFGPELAGGTTASQAVTISNPGTAPLQFTDISASNSFSVASGGTCSTSNAVAPSGDCTVNVAFAPTMGGDLTGSLTLTDNGIGSPHTVALAGTGQDFALSANSATASVSPGSTATYALSVAPEGGFDQQITFGCVGGPPFSECTVSPNHVVPDGASPASVTVSVKTYAASLAAPPGSEISNLRFQVPFLSGFQISNFKFLISFLLALLALAIAGVGLAQTRAAIRARIPNPQPLIPAGAPRLPTPDSRLPLRLRLRWGGLAALALGMAMLASCGGGGSNTVQRPGTPKGDYTLTITARTTAGTTTVTHTLTLDLKVN
jgi:Beta-propeller repeat/Abnormal spindle-like microcephaly-assoc'd, ASPM-SPD-2-Hydin